MKAPRDIPAALLMLALATPGLAHHGVAPHYDDSKRVRIEGVVAKFDFINPHAYVYVTTVDDRGAEETWSCELASRSVLARNGLTAEMFAPGTRVTIEGIAARTNPTGCALRTARFPDGTLLQSTALFGATPATAADVPADRDSIFGTWTMKVFSVPLYEGVLTEAGERARAAFDPIADDPAIHCDPASPVRFWVNVNEPFEIRQEDGTIVIDNQFVDSRRVVHLGLDATPAEAAPSTMGYSRGRFDGEVLLVFTDRFTAGVLEPRRAVMHTADLELTERLEVDAATGELVITWTIDDPAYFKEPLTHAERFIRTPWERMPYDCKPGYHQ